MEQIALKTTVLKASKSEAEKIATTLMSYINPVSGKCPFRRIELENGFKVLAIMINKDGEKVKSSILEYLETSTGNVFRYDERLIKIN